MSTHQLAFELNGSGVTVTVPAERLLIDVLREDLDLTGTREGCSIGVCGACSVLVDGQLLSACLLPALFVDGASVRTIESLASDGQPLTPVQDAFIRHGGFQCGICTSGQIMAATALLEECPHPNAEQVRTWMMGNLCRCTGYFKIAESILAAADQDQPESATLAETETSKG